MSKYLKTIKQIAVSGLLAALFSSCANNYNTSYLLPPVNAPAQNSVQQSSQLQETAILAKSSYKHGIYNGIVTELLPDDLDGLKHQHFIIRITDKRYGNSMVKIAHNIDQAPYVPVKVGDQVEVKGDLITNEDPMVLHWTHLTYGKNTHPHGYIKLNGKTYQ